MGEIFKFFSIIIIFFQCFQGMISQTYSRMFGGLTAVPRDIPDGTTWISLQYNLIRIIDDSSFYYADFSSVTTLVLYDNSIEIISKGAFAGFANLKRLLLSNNRLRELELDCNDLPNLSELDLQSNLLVAMPAFHGNCSSLEILELSFNNIDQIISEDFENITNVNSIKLGSNDVISFPSFHGSNILLNEVTEIDLVFNELKLINARAFEGFGKLDRIDMTYVTVLSLLEMHSGGNVRRPRCRPFSPGILGASDLILLYYCGGLCSVAPMSGGPCSAVLRHLKAANALVHV